MQGGSVLLCLLCSEGWGEGKGRGEVICEVGQSVRRYWGFGVVR